MKEFIQKQVSSIKEFTENLLPNYNETTLKKLFYIFLSYDMVVRPNFILWLMLTKSYAKTEKGIMVITDNIRCEVEENHPQLLLNVTAKVLGNVISPRDIYKEVDKKILPIIANEVRVLTSNAKGVEGFFIMALLENASLVFIPWFSEVALHRLGVDDLTYFRIHGQADIKHANDFIDATNTELDRAISDFCEENHITDSSVVERNYEEKMREVSKKVKRVLSSIFSF